MKRILVYCMATLFVAIGAYFILQKSSEDEVSSEDKADLVAQGNSDEKAVTKKESSNGDLGNKEFQKIVERFQNAKVTPVTRPRPLIYNTYVDQEMADEIGLDHHQRAEMERIIDYYKEKMDEINLNNATVTALSDNKFVIEISKSEEQGLEIRNKIVEEISTLIGLEKFNKFMKQNRNLSDYFKGFGQSARTLEIEILEATNVLGRIAKIDHTFEDFRYRRETSIPLSGLVHFMPVSTLIDQPDL